MSTTFEIFSIDKSTEFNDKQFWNQWNLMICNFGINVTWFQYYYYFSKNLSQLNLMRRSYQISEI